MSRHIRIGPPGPGEEETMSDEELKYLILGCWRGAASLEQFPVLIDHIEDNHDENQIIESFTIVTASGLRFTTRVEFEPAPPVPNTKEENIAFRKEWDARVSGET